jgi:gliding motility-associated-like protein
MFDSRLTINYLLTISFGLLIKVTSVAQWTPQQNLPSTPRAATGSFSIGNFGYIVGGESGSGTLSDCWKFDPSLNTWSALPSFPGTPRTKPVSFAINGIGYYGLGSDNTFFSFNPSTNLWTQLSTPTIPGNYWGTSYFVIGTDVYFLLGSQNKVIQYNTLTDTWIQMNNFPGTTRFSGRGFTANGKGYITCGVNTFGNPYLNDLWEYNPQNDTWIQKSSLPATGRYAFFSYSFGERGYIVGGERYNPNTTLNEFWQYNPQTDQWSQLPSFPANRNYISGFNIGCTLYGGFGSFGYNSDFHKYDMVYNNPGASSINAGTDFSICEGSSFTLNGTGGSNLLWENNFSNGQTIVPTQSGLYILSGIDSIGCIGTDTLSVTITPNQTAFFPSVNPICAGDPLPPLPTSSLNLFQGTWSPAINNMITTTYTFSPNLNVCAWDTTTLTIVVKPVPILTSQDITSCLGQQITVSAVPDLPNGTFNWSNGSTANQFNITADTSILYTVNYTLDGCNSEMDTVTVTVNSLPLVSITPNGPTTFCAESSVNLTSSSAVGNFWSNGQITQNITASSSGTYQVTVTDSNGCVDSTSILITNTGVPCLEIGGIFTPNGDGTNDSWLIPGIEFYPNAKVEIYNRWGQQLFLSNGYSIPWNGSYNNEPLPTGDYFYIIDLGNGSPIKGSITLKN